MSSLHKLDGEDAVRVLPNFSAWLQDLMPDYTVESIGEKLKEGTFHLWCVQEEGQLLGVALTAIATYPKRSKLRFLVLFGKDLKTWDHYLTEIEHWAHELGATQTEGWCRPGLAELLCDRHGFQRRYDVVSREIKHGHELH